MGAAGDTGGGDGRFEEVLVLISRVAEGARDEYPTRTRLLLYALGHSRRANVPLTESGLDPDFDAGLLAAGEQILELLATASAEIPTRVPALQAAVAKILSAD